MNIIGPQPDPTAALTAMTITSAAIGYAIGDERGAAVGIAVAGAFSTFALFGRMGREQEDIDAVKAELLARAEHYAARSTGRAPLTTEEEDRLAG